MQLLHTLYNINVHVIIEEFWYQVQIHRLLMYHYGYLNFIFVMISSGLCADRGGARHLSPKIQTAWFHYVGKFGDHSLGRLTEIMDLHLGKSRSRTY